VRKKDLQNICEFAGEMERGHLAFLLLFLLLLPSICECLSYVEPMEESLKETGVENGRARTNAYVVVDIHERDGTKCVTAVKDFGRGCQL
jgi:hypothetical protein